MKSSIKLIKPSKILIESLLIQIYISLPQIKIFSPNGSFFNQNWVVNFVNFIHSGPPTFSLVILVRHHLLGFFFFYMYPLVFLDFIFLFFFFS